MYSKIDNKTDKTCIAIPAKLLLIYVFSQKLEIFNPLGGGFKWSLRCLSATISTFLYTSEKIER